MLMPQKRVERLFEKVAKRGKNSSSMSAPVNTQNSIERALRKAYSSNLSAAQVKLIEPLLPVAKQGGRHLHLRLS